jgi:Mannosyltransferase (PIG-V)
MNDTTRQSSGAHAGRAIFCSSGAWQASPRPYCQPGGPSLYAHVQATYWGVGFVRYYEWKQARPPQLHCLTSMSVASCLDQCGTRHCNNFMQFHGSQCAAMSKRRKVIERSMLQVPNFIIASPIVALAACAVLEYVAAQPAVSATLGGIIPMGLLPWKPAQMEHVCEGYPAQAMFVYVAQLAAMLLFGVAFMYIQVRLAAARRRCLTHASD